MNETVRARRPLRASTDLRLSLGRSFHWIIPRRRQAQTRDMASGNRGIRDPPLQLFLAIGALISFYQVVLLKEFLKKHLKWICVLFVVYLFWMGLSTVIERKQRQTAVDNWLDEHKLSKLKYDFRKQGYNTLEKCANIDVPSFISKTNKWTPTFWVSYTAQTEQLQEAVHALQHQLQFRNWLISLNLYHCYHMFVYLGYKTIADIKDHLTDDAILEVFAYHGEVHRIVAFRKQLADLKSGKTKNIPFILNAESNSLMGFLWFLFKQAAKLVLVIYGCIVLDKAQQRVRSRRGNVALSSYITGNYLDANKCLVEWKWQNPVAVGNTLNFIVKFYRNNGTVYPVGKSDNVLVEIFHENGTQVEASVAFPDDVTGSDSTQSHEVKVTFTVRHSGLYKINVLLGGLHIAESPFRKTFTPCGVDPSKSVILQSLSTTVITKGIYHDLDVECRDKYDNICPLVMERTDFYKVEVTEIGHGHGHVDPELFVMADSSNKRNTLHIKLEREGCYRCTVSYNGETLQNGELILISLNEKDREKVQNFVEGRNWTSWYEGYLLAPTSTQEIPTSNPPARQIEPTTSSNQNFVQYKKLGKVYFYVSPRQLTVKEFYLKFIPYRLHTVRVCPSTKIHVNLPTNTGLKYPTFTIDDGTQPPIRAMCKDRNILLATFSEFLHKNIGGSETFNDKKTFFYNELYSYHRKRISSNKVYLYIDRSRILESSMSATKSLSTSDWCKSFNITFNHEEGMDYGGLSREWFELVCKAIFNPENLLFTRFQEDDPQALVHPSPKRPPHMKLKYFEFAGRLVGKCLLESSISPSRRQNVKARFTRSFLAQLIGLRVNYRYFESDDKQLYTSKIKYIEENDPEDLDLVFAEEEFNQGKELEKVVELKTGGVNIPVTQDNKLEYLDLLSQYRMAKRVHQEIEAFQKGLNELVPDNLLSIFDENELELLMCGTGGISVEDFRNHHERVGFMSSLAFRRNLDWFWTVIGSFTQEELSRLVQFITGSSQLPPGGFAELSPKIKISGMSSFDCLPTAHTCFNNICLPIYNSCEDLQRCLLLAINEGNEGFGFS